MYRLIVIAILMLASTARAGEGDTHFAAHFGASYALETFTYGVSTRAMGMDRANAIVFSTFTTLAAGFIYKYMENVEDGRMPTNTGKAMMQNALGAGASIGTVLMFGF